MSLVREVQADQHGLAEQIASSDAHPFSPVVVVLGMPSQIGPRGLVNEVPNQEGMGVDIVKVMGNGGVPLPIVADDVVPIGEEPIGHVQEREERWIVIQLDKGPVPRRVLGTGNALGGEKVFTIIAVHEGAEQVPFSIKCGTHIHADAAEGLATSSNGLARGAGRVHHGWGVSIGAENTDPMAGHNPIPPK